MTYLAPSLFGSSLPQSTTVDEVAEILRKFPAASERPGLFFYLVLKERCPWIIQLPAEKQLELQDFLHTIVSLNRRRQEMRDNVKETPFHAKS